MIVGGFRERIPPFGISGEVSRYQHVELLKM